MRLTGLPALDQASTERHWNIVIFWGVHTNHYLSYVKQELLLKLNTLMEVTKLTVISNINLFLKWRWRSALCGRYSRHQVAHFRPEAEVPGGGPSRFVSPPQGGALHDQVLQARRKMGESSWYSVSNLYQNHTDITLDESMVQHNLGGKKRCYTKRNDIKIN